MKRLISAAILLLILLPAKSQVGKQDSELKREITLYNPYKPSLPDVRKKSFLPDINDTSKINLSVSYDIRPNKFSPVYSLNPIKPAALLSDPLPKLYKGYVNIGVGTYITPLAELSITNERSKSGAVGLYARHYSSQGKVLLQNNERVFAGLMDNEAVIFGKRFFRDSYIKGSADFTQNTRYSYGYKPEITGYDPSRKENKLVYNNIGANLSFASLNLDSTEFSYDFEIDWNMFRTTKDFIQHHGGLKGEMAKMFKEFYIGSGISYDHYKLPPALLEKPRFIFSATPFVSKNKEQWNFKLGAEIMLERDAKYSTRVHLFPDVNFGFSVVPDYIRFYTGLGGKLERNLPEHVIKENPFLVPDGSLFLLPNTEHAIIIFAGLRGNNGIGGNYVISASYSMLDNMLTFSNIVFPDTAMRIERGNYFIPVTDEAEILNIHGEINGTITDKVTFHASGNYNKYTLSASSHPWNRPPWDAKIGVNYNLRNKIIAGAEITALGKRKLMVSESPTGWQTLAPSIIDMPSHVNLNLSAEYRYTKILSFWTRVNNVSWNRYLEWAYYPTQRFLIMAGFTYSL